jgi:hypothetical protein
LDFITDWKFAKESVKKLAALQPKLLFQDMVYQV